MNWTVTLGTTDVSCVRAWLDPNAPWPMSHVITALGGLGHRPRQRPDAVGSGHGNPIIHRASFEQPLPLDLEVISAQGRELVMEFPAGADLPEVIDEGAFWLLIDTVLEAADTDCAILGDGEALPAVPPDGPAKWRREALRHTAVIVPPRLARLGGPDLFLYRSLPRSDLVVLLR